MPRCRTGNNVVTTVQEDSNMDDEDQVDVVVEHILELGMKTEDAKDRSKRTQNMFLPCQATILATTQSTISLDTWSFKEGS